VLSDAAREQTGTETTDFTRRNKETGDLISVGSRANIPPLYPAGSRTHPPEKRKLTGEEGSQECHNPKEAKRESL
jgi:hypothetical protein